MTVVVVYFLFDFLTARSTHLFPPGFFGRLFDGLLWCLPLLAIFLELGSCLVGKYQVSCMISLKNKLAYLLLRLILGEVIFWWN
jgi:hypothetical protein